MLRIIAGLVFLGGALLWYSDQEHYEAAKAPKRFVIIGYDYQPPEDTMGTQAGPALDVQDAITQ